MMAVLYTTPYYSARVRLHGISITVVLGGERGTTKAPQNEWGHPRVGLRPKNVKRKSR